MTLMQAYTSSGIPPADSDQAIAPDVRKAHAVVLIDSPVVRARVTECLQSSYHPHAYLDVTSSLAACRQYLPDVVLVGDDLAHKLGFDFVRLVRMDRSLANVRTLMLVKNDDRMTRDLVAQCGADAHLPMCCTRDALCDAVARLVNQNVERAWARLPSVQRQALRDTVTIFRQIAAVVDKGTPITYGAVRIACHPLMQAVGNGEFKGLLRSVQEHNDGLYTHSLRVATLLAVLGRRLCLPRDQQLTLATGGLLHDIGKMVVPREILNKPGRLSEAEFAVMKKHVDASVAYLRRCGDVPGAVLTIAAQHHERLDGTGYPRGLSGAHLNELARLASIADVFSALTDRRVYRPAMSAEAALRVMAEEMVGHLDQKLLQLCRDTLLDATRDTTIA